MPFNLLFFPLAGGFYFYTNFHYFQYTQHRSESQRLVFHSAFWGIFSLLLTYLFRMAADSFCPGLINSFWHFALQQLNMPHLGTSLVAFALPVFFAEISNLLTDRTKMIRRANRKIGNELELILFTSFDEPHLIQVTLKNDKFYVGWITRIPIPSRANYVRLLPVFSGYRNEKKKLVFTTEYLGVYASYVEEGAIKSVAELNAEIIIKTDEIITANSFDIKMYEKFNDGPIDTKPLTK